MKFYKALFLFLYMVKAFSVDKVLQAFIGMLYSE